VVVTLGFFYDLITITVSFFNRAIMNNKAYIVFSLS